MSVVWMVYSANADTQEKVDEGELTNGAPPGTVFSV